MSIHPSVTGPWLALLPDGSENGTHLLFTVSWRLFWNASVGKSMSLYFHEGCIARSQPLEKEIIRKQAEDFQQCATGSTLVICSIFSYLHLCLFYSNHVCLPVVSKTAWTWHHPRGFASAPWNPLLLQTFIFLLSLLNCQLLFLITLSKIVSLTKKKWMSPLQLQHLSLLAILHISILCLLSIFPSGL